MSVKLQQLLLLLGIALVTIGLSAWQSLRQIDLMAAGIAEATRHSVLERDSHYMREKVADIGTALQLITQSTEGLLRRQRDLVESSLNNPYPTPGRVIYAEEIRGLPDSVEDKRFRRSEALASNQYVRVQLDHPSILLADPDCGITCEDMASALTSRVEELRAIHDDSSGFSLWHYSGFDNGMVLTFPGHGDFPPGYDPRQRPWYIDVLKRQQNVWLPLTIDASTGQPVLTAAAPLRDSAGKTIGVTAIDLPLQQLLKFHSSAAPWLNVSRLALLRLDKQGELEIMAMKEPLQMDSDWRSNEQTRRLSGITPEILDKVKQLQLGDSLLVSTASIEGERYNTALTAMNSSGNRSWLALVSPHSAIESAVADALKVVEAQRQATIQQYAIGSVVLLMLVIGIALYFANRFTAPLIRMSATAEELAAGNLASRTGLERDDEVGALSSSIDRMADSIEQLQLEQEKAYRDMITSLHRALEKKDSYTAGHSGRVTRSSMKLGERIGLDKDTLEKLRFGSITHDLGKIGIPDAVLNKPAPLDEAEFEIMKQHPAFSKTIMKPLVRFQEYAEIAGSHHENWDGSGYPDGIKGEDIPLLARIVAIADAWDAMTGDRVYRKGMTDQVAIDILDREKDKGQFDPKLIREFIALVREELDVNG